MGDEFNLKGERTHLVAKDNRLIQNSRMSLGLLENKAILYLISKIRPDDKPGKIYVFSCREFMTLMNWGTDNSCQKIKKMLQLLGDKSIWIEDKIEGRTKEILLRWFDIVHVDSECDEIEISFHQDMLPFLLNLQQNLEENRRYYTTYQLQNVTLMKHNYSSRIYELLKSYQYNNKKWTFEIGTGTEFDLQRRIANTVMDKSTGKAIPKIPKSWSNWAIFKRDVLAPAIEEINRYTDLKVDYEGKKEDLRHRKTRAVKTIDFYMVEKTSLEQSQTNQLIDEIYGMTETEDDCHQMSIEDLFFQEHESSLKEEKAELEWHEESEIEEQASKSNCPALYGVLNGDRHANFDEAKVVQLYRTAICDRVIGLRIICWELFATDLVIYYYDKIVATSENTKTSLYNRLLDSVRKDYDCQVPILREKYGR